MKVDFINGLIYQIITDRFFSGRNENNHCQENNEDFNYQGGTWKGIIEKIVDGYLINLGVTTIWISPPVENINGLLNEKGKTISSYHGYWAKDFTRPNLNFGDFEDFKQLIRVAHENNIKIVIDFAPHHTSPIMEENEFFLDDGALYDNGVKQCSYHEDNHNLYHHNGNSDKTYEGGIYQNIYGLASLNLHSPSITNYLINAIKVWLKLGVDGIRLDGARHMPVGWIKSFINNIQLDFPVFIFAEWFLGPNRDDSKLYELANSGFTSVFNFKFSHGLRKAIYNKESNFKWNAFSKVLMESNILFDRDVEHIIFLDNHDLPRFTLNESCKEFTDIGLVILFTSKGIPCIYYGTEQYMQGNGDPQNRRMMNSFSTTTTAYKIINLLSNLRRNNIALVLGELQVLNTSGNVFIYERFYEESVVLIMVNVGETEQVMTDIITRLPIGTYKDNLNGFLLGRDLQVKEGGVIKNLYLYPKQASIYEYKKDVTKPSIMHIYPTSTVIGASINISGYNFGNEKGSVRIAEKTSEILEWNDNKIKVKVPEFARGECELSVVTKQEKELVSYSKILINRRKLQTIRIIAYVISEDENIFIVGDIFELGQWNNEKCIGPFFNRILYKQPYWYYDISIPEDTEFQFKLLKKNFDSKIIEESRIYNSMEFVKLGKKEILVNWEL